MAFIEQQRIIHRDIAARNVLVGKDAANVKMADLGAARNVHRTRALASNGVYVAKTNHTPARWMPLEALREAKFSHKSDVFAFGVLLWEILSLGQTPWGAFGVGDFTRALAKGERLKFPTACERGLSEAETCTAMTIFAIALRCWQEVPAKRPHFHQLEAEFAVHHTVLATTQAVTAPPRSIPGVGRLARATTEHLQLVTSKADQRPTVFDADGYVADSGASQQPTLSTDGYVVDNQYNQRGDLNAASLVGGAAPSNSARRGIAARSARNPSVYLGFEHAEPSSSTSLHDDETRL
jgi:serine/threonine protein kinase